MSDEPSPYQVSEVGMSPVGNAGQPPALPTAAPRVFGIIHIVYACLGIVLSLVGLGALFAMRALIGHMEAEELKEVEKMLGAFDEMIIYVYLDVSLKVILGLSLLVAGIGLLKRKLWAQRLSIFWAVARIVVAAGMLVLMAGPTRAFQERTSQFGGEQQEQLQQMLQGVGNVIGLIFICAYPVLILVMLTRKKVTDALG